MIIDMLTAYILANITLQRDTRVDGYTMVDTAINIEYSSERASGGRKNFTCRVSLLELLAFVWSQTK